MSEISAISKISEISEISEINQYAIVLAGHGSRDPKGVSEFEELAELIKQQSAPRAMRHGYLEFASPTIVEAVESLIKDGHKSIVVVPALLAAATHAKNDMPGILLMLKQSFPDIDLHFGAALDLHPELLSLCRTRIIEAESATDNIVRREDSCLVVVGRGTSDPDANSNISKLCRILEEGLGFGAAFVCYSGSTSPLVAEGLRMAASLGKNRLVILPYMLFDGVLVKRIYAAVDQLSAAQPELEVLKAGYLGCDLALANVFLERAQSGFAGEANMNCLLCKYRVQIVGYERQVGIPQQAAVKLPLQAAQMQVIQPYSPHPIEAESFRIIEQGRDWSTVPVEIWPIAKRLVHTSGDFAVPDELFVSSGAVASGIKALLRCRRVVTDVTMVESGIRKDLLKTLEITTWCGVHDTETRVLAESAGITRSAAGIRRAWQLFGNDLVLAIGDAPTAVAEAVRLIKEQHWRPQLVIGLPVGFVGTAESKLALRTCLQVPRITNSGTRGGSPWAATVVNAMMIEAVNMLAAVYSKQQSEAGIAEVADVRA
jgi:precorrin-8X/cobalt-precorrin-8 methylmutase